MAVRSGDQLGSVGVSRDSSEGFALRRDFSARFRQSPANAGKGRPKLGSILKMGQRDIMGLLVALELERKFSSFA